MDHPKIFVAWTDGKTRDLDVCLHAIQRRASDLVEIVPIKQAKPARPGGPTLAFAGKTPFTVPALNGFAGWAAFIRSDMLFLADVYELWRLRDERCAVMDVRRERTARGQEPPWCRPLLWNCAHPANRALTEGFLAQAGDDALNRFAWLDETARGCLPEAWNWREGQSDPAIPPKAVEFAAAPAVDAVNRAPLYADLWRREEKRIYGDLPARASAF